MASDQLLITAVLIALVAMVGNAPNWVIPLVALPPARPIRSRSAASRA